RRERAVTEAALVRGGRGGGGRGRRPRSREGVGCDGCWRGGGESPRRPWGQAIVLRSCGAARCTDTFSPSRREQSSGRGQSLRGRTALPTTLEPVSQTGRNRPYKGRSDLARGVSPGSRRAPYRATFLYIPSARPRVHPGSGR